MGCPGDEVSFQDMQNGITSHGKKGYDKIRFCIEQANKTD